VTIKFNEKFHYRGKECVKCGSDVRYIKGDRCVPCWLARNKYNYAKFKDKILAQQKEYYEENKERILTYHKNWREENADHLVEYRKRNKDRIKANRKQYYKKNKEKELEQNRQWQEENPDYFKEYYQENKDKVSERNKNWRKRNKHKARVYRHNRRARIAKNGGEFTEEEWLNLCDKYNHTCLCCKTNSVPVTLDHIIPVSKGGSNNIYNIQPLCLSCNDKKATQIIDYRPVTDVPVEFKKELKRILKDLEQE
jgi:hypothetical protein